MSLSTAPVASLNTASLTSLYGAYNYSTVANTSPVWGTSLGKTNATYNDITVDGKFTIRGIDVGRTLEIIAERLCIIQDSSKHKQFTALKKAYDQYKMVEALCTVSTISS